MQDAPAGLGSFRPGLQGHYADALPRMAGNADLPDVRNGLLLQPLHPSDTTPVDSTSSGARWLQGTQLQGYCESVIFFFRIQYDHMSGDAMLPGNRIPTPSEEIRVGKQARHAAELGHQP